MSFGDNLERLDEVLGRLESEPMTLDEAMKLFEEGVALVRKNSAVLAKAEQKVTLLTERGEAAFDAASDGADSSAD